MKFVLIFINKYWILLSIVFIFIISFLSLWPIDKLPSVPGTDKTHHILAYAILVMPTAIRKPKNWIHICLLFIAYSGAIELLQPYVNRHGELLDMIANTTGVIAGTLLSNLLTRLKPIPLNNN